MTRGTALNLRLAALLLLLACLSLFAGRVWVPFGLWGRDEPLWWIIVELRLPRALLAMLIGAGLGLSGAVLQGYLRNPLADPGVLGISATAALGAVLAIYFGMGGGWGLPALAMLGAGIGMALLALLAGRGGGTIRFLLAGVMLANLAGALTALVITLAPNPFATSEILTWLIGALSDRSFADVRIAAVALLFGGLPLYLAAPALDALSLGETAARSLGVDLARTQRLILIGTGVAIGGAVAVSGVIGFVGLVAPHLMRPLVRGRPSALLLPSALTGAALLLAADSLARVLPTASELRVGVVMALLGAPFFALLLLRLRRGAA